MVVPFYEPVPETGIASYADRFAQHKKMRIRQSAGCTGTLFQVTVTLPVRFFIVKTMQFQRGNDAGY